MQGGGYDQGFHEIHMKSAGFHVKSARFHEIRRISREIRRISCEIERPLARNCNPMFLKLKLETNTLVSSYSLFQMYSP